MFSILSNKKSARVSSRELFLFFTILLTIHKTTENFNQIFYKNIFIHIIGEIFLCIYMKVLLKISGEALQGNHSHGVDPLFLKDLAKDLTKILENGHSLAIVLG